MMPQSLTSIRRRAANDTLEVEHILEAAVLRVEGLAELIDELSVAHDWSDRPYLPDGTHVVPLARWARVASAYCREGFGGLKSILSVPDHESYVLALLQELHSAEAVAVVQDLFGEWIDAPECDAKLTGMVAGCLNFILCFKPHVAIAAEDQSRLRGFAAKLIALADNQVERATPVLLLRAVGDEASLKFLDTLPPFTDAWETVIPTTKREIRKRLKQRA